MKVHGYLSGNETHDHVMRSFMSGVPEEHECLLVDDWSYRDPDIAVVFGVHKIKVPISWPRGGIIRQHQEKGRDVVVLETGYVNRGDGFYDYYAAGFNGLNNRADFRNEGMPDDRWQDWDIKGWHGGEYVILAGQIPWDASCQHVDLQDWLRHAYRMIKANTEREVLYRPHPLMKNDPLASDAVQTISGPLDKALEKAHALVTFNSNSSVDAVIAGVPVFVQDEGAMSWDVAVRLGEDGWHIDAPWAGDRRPWFNKLSYTQWTPGEMAKGETWKHLFR